MAPERPNTDQRLTNLQLQADRLRLHTEGTGLSVEQKLASLAEQYGQHLERWATTVERHSRAVTQLEDCVSHWTDASIRVRQHAADRLLDLDAAIEHEWQTLKAKQEVPLRALQAQVENLAQASTAMMSASQQGVGRAAERFTSFEAEVRLRFDEMTREFAAAVAEMKARLDATPPREASSEWSLEDVTRLHGRLRGGAQKAPALPAAVAAVPGDGLPSDLVAIGSGRTVEHEQQAGGLPTRWAAAIAVLGLAVVGGGVFAWRLQSQVAQSNEVAVVAQQKAELAMSDAAQQNEAMRKQLALNAAAHREMAARATRVADVVAAPDLVRLPLSGENGASGHALFSRSRGLVVSGDGLPSQSGDRVLQAWLLTRDAPVKVGALVTEPDGRVLLAQQLSQVPPVPVLGVIVTSDAVQEEDRPGTPVLTSLRR